MQSSDCPSPSGMPYVFSIDFPPNVCMYVMADEMAKMSQKSADLTDVESESNQSKCQGT